MDLINAGDRYRAKKCQETAGGARGKQQERCGLQK